MKTNQSRQDAVREPQQSRSQKRVEQILAATEQVILTKGYASLKMSDIASEAGISIASIYQYFPNRGGIISALFQKYLDETNREIGKAFAQPPRNIAAMAETISAVVEGYYEFHLKTPVLRDLSAGYLADKELQDVDDDDTQRNVDHICKQTLHLFAEGSEPELRRSLLLMVRFTDAAVAEAVEMSDKEGKDLITSTRTMLVALCKDLGKRLR